MSLLPTLFYPTIRGDFIIVQTGENEFRPGVAVKVSGDKMLMEWRGLGTTKVLLGPPQPFLQDLPTWTISQRVINVNLALRTAKDLHHRPDLPNEPEPFTSMEELIAFITPFLSEEFFEPPEV